MLAFAAALSLSACGSLPKLEVFSKPAPTDFLTLEPVRWAPTSGADPGWVSVAPGSATQTWMMRIGSRQYEEMVGTAKGQEVRSRLAGYAARELLERRLCTGGRVTLRTPPMGPDDRTETSFVVECGG